ncbi:MAG: hypothetical protein ABL885_12280 [Methylophilaceae bacterium]
MSTSKKFPPDFNGGWLGVWAAFASQVDAKHHSTCRVGQCPR